MQRLSSTPQGDFLNMATPQTWILNTNQPELYFEEAVEEKARFKFKITDSYIQVKLINTRKLVCALRMLKSVILTWFL